VHRIQGTTGGHPPIVYPFVQTFYSAKTGFAKYFTVDPALTSVFHLPIPSGALESNEDNISLHDADLGCNLVEHIVEKNARLQSTMCPSQGDVGKAAIIFTQGWADHFAGYNALLLSGLVQQPKTKGGCWSILCKTCLSLFYQYQTTITSTPSHIQEMWVDPASINGFSGYSRLFSCVSRKETVTTQLGL
jgi:hypothetical protein